MACTVCGKVYVWNPDENVDAKPHVCKTCGFSFSLKIQLKRHTLIHANNEPYVCITCTSNPCKEESKSYNLRLSNKIDNYPCEVCGESFSSKRLLLRHSIKEHSFQNSDEESEINRSESEESDFMVDLDEPVKKRSRRKTRGPSKKKKVPTEQQQFTCSNCWKAFVYQASYEKHVRFGKCLDDPDTPVKNSLFTKKVKKTGPKKKNHECDVCGKNFTRKSSLEGHMKEHEREDIQYDDYSSDNGAANSEEEPDEKPIKTTNIKKSFTCEQCNFVCFSQITLDKHTNNHHKQAKVVTEFLAEEGATRAEEESTENSSEKPKETYLCEICDKVFLSKGRLKKHLLFHVTNELDSGSLPPPRHLFGTRKKVKRYRCDECGKQFAGLACLERHTRRHSESADRPPKEKRGQFKAMECEFCHEVFCTKRSTFMKHVHSHTPEVCGICDERFVDRASLREHCKIHIGTEEGKMFVECSQKALEAKLGILPPEPKVEYIYLVLR